MLRSADETAETKPSPPLAVGRAAPRPVIRGIRGFHYRSPRWGLRPWFGMRLSAWLSLLVRNRCAVSLARLPTALLITLFAGINAMLGLGQTIVFGGRIKATKLADDPIFIIGHWRAGTTFLHELLALDDRFVWPTTHECFAPSHFLVSRWLAPLVRRFAPQHRPMDRMRFGLDRPQEDEWAIAMLGLGSPYETIAFPDHRPARQQFLGLRELPPGNLQRWETGFRRFLQSVQLRASRDGADRRSLLLKSPTHTARLSVLCRMFPEARFIHVVRDPAELFASTVRLWTVLFDVYGCHKPHREALPGGVPSIAEYVLLMLPLLYRDFDRARAAIPPERWCDIRFEDLVRDPTAEIEQIYRQLRLGSFASVREKIASYVDEFGAERSEYELPPELRAEVAARWRDYRERYGY